MVSISCSLVTRFHQIFFKTAPRIATKIPMPYGDSLEGFDLGFEFHEFRL